MPDAVFIIPHTLNAHNDITQTHGGSGTITKHTKIKFY